MHDADTIEAINCEQLATATDRLLLRGGRLSKHRPSTRSFSASTRGSWVHLTQPAPVARGSQIARSAAVARAPRSFEIPAYEHTVPARRRTAYTQMFAITVTIPTLVGLALGLAALL
jgi:hypothetical protein